MSKKIKCPYCESTDTKILNYINHYAMVCNECKAAGPECKSKEAAIKSWEHRVMWAIFPLGNNGLCLEFTIRPHRAYSINSLFNLRAYRETTWMQLHRQGWRCRKVIVMIGADR